MASFTKLNAEKDISAKRTGVGGGTIVYKIYGEHNKPGIGDVSGLSAKLNDIEARLSALEH